MALNTNDSKISFQKGYFDLHDRLPTATYSIRHDECKGVFYLEVFDDLKLEGKLYGDVDKKSYRILHTFLDRPRSAGVLIVGCKGSGKTCLSQKICIDAARKHDIPTIVVNKPWHGDDFNIFLQSICQPTIFLFNKFEKVYKIECGDNPQQKILTFFDGVYSSQKLFLLTCNDKHEMDDHM